MSERGKVICPFPAERSAIPHARSIRSTWIIASLQTLRARGHLDRYLTYIPEEHREALLFCVAGSWLPMSLAMIHYQACESLGLTVVEILAMGMSVSERAQGAMLSLSTKLAKSAGVTPYTILPQFNRIWTRGFDGGAVAIYESGPKEGILDAVGLPLLSIGYYRTAMRGVILAVVNPFCAKAYCHDITPKTTTRDAATYRIQWA